MGKTTFSNYAKKRGDFVRNTMLWTILAMTVVTAAAAGLGFVAGKNTNYMPPGGYSVVEHESNLPQSSRTAAPKYRLGELDGRLAVYTIGKDTPDLVFDLYIKYLPPLDQQALAEGIIIYDYKELTERIEDYIS